jgi:anti-anti-sigma factor
VKVVEAPLTTHVVPGTPYRVILVGEVDLDTFEQLDAALSAAPGDVLVDCTGLTFLNSIGISVIVRHCTSRRAVGHTLALENVSRLIHRTLEVTGLATMLLQPEGDR